MFGVVLIAICLHFHIKAAFSVALVVCSLAWWGDSNTWPTTIAADPVAPTYREFSDGSGLDDMTFQLVLNLIFLHACSLNGVARAFSDLAGLTTPAGVVPRGRWLYVVTGTMNILSGFHGGPPILLCPESGAGIKAGARTGLSSIFCGVFFGVSVFFTPLFSRIPFAGTAPLLIAIGTILFANTSKIDWADYKLAYPAYIVLFLIPFTYSILLGAIVGWLAYMCINLFTGDLLKHTKWFLEYYTPRKPMREYLTWSYILHSVWYNVFQLDDDEYDPALHQETHAFISWPHYGTKIGFDLPSYLFPPKQATHFPSDDFNDAFSPSSDTPNGDDEESHNGVEHPIHRTLAISAGVSAKSTASD